MKHKTPTEKAKEFSQSSTLHGISVIGDSTAPVPRRLFWGSLVLGGLVFLVYKGTQLTMRAIDPKTETSISVEFGFPYMEFPAVTICNINVFNKTYMKENPDFRLALRRVLGKRTARQNAVLDLNITDHVIAAGHRLDETLIFCKIKGKMSNCLEMFNGVLTENGYCYTFNGDRNNSLRTSLTGVDFGVQLLLNVKQSEYYLSDKLLGSSGFKVLLHEQDDTPLMGVNELSISPGQETLISIRRTRYVLEKYMDCVDTVDTDFVNPLEYYPYYTRLACQQECLYKYLENTCGCRHFLHRGNKDFCDTADDVTCLSEASENFTMDSAGLPNCGCREVCEKVEYDTKLSHARFPAPYFVKTLRQTFNVTSEDARENMALLCLYYQILSETVIRQSYSYDFSFLGGDIGGYMGLFLGASVITCWEILEFLFDICRTRFCKSQKNMDSVSPSEGKY